MPVSKTQEALNRPVRPENGLSSAWEGPIGVIAPMASEYACLGSLPALSPQGLLAVCSGMGAARAADAARRLVDGGARLLLSFGLAGGLSGALKAGDLFLASEVCSASGQVLALAPLPAAVGAAAQQGGRLLSSDTAILLPAEKQRLARRWAAESVDMETFAIAAVAAEAGRSCAAIRVVVDHAGMTVPAAITGCVDAFGRPQPGRLAATIVRRPGLLPALVHLALADYEARKTLRLTAQRLGEMLSA